MRERFIPFLILLLASVLQTSAQTLNDRYNRQHPVVIVLDNSHSVDDMGAPSEHCAAIAKAVTDELGLPCRIVAKDKDEARQSFERGEADIIVTESMNYRPPTYFTSKNVIDYSLTSDSSIAEARMVSRDHQLIETLDNEFTRLKESGYLSLIQERWTHPERATPEAKPVALYIAAVLFVLAAVFLVLWLLLILHHRRTHRYTKVLREMIIQESHMGHFYEVEDNQAAHDLIHKYDAILCNPFVAISFYDHNGRFIIENDAMRQLGDEDTTSYRQPLYNAEGEVTNYFVAIRRPATT